MLDVHVIVSATTPRGWVTQCLDSVHEAAERAPFKVNVWPVEGVPGHVGQARAAGYALGAHPYVTQVDDDDYVLPHAFAQLHAGLCAGMDAVFTPELLWQGGQIKPGGVHHHLYAFRRELVIDHAAWPCCGDIAQIRALERMPDTLEVREPAYVHRLYSSSRARQLRRRYPDEARRAYG